MKNINWNNVEEAQEFKKVTSGGYICKITLAEDVADKEYTYFEYDIAEGEFKGYYDDLYKSKGFWGAKLFKSYKENALPFYKGMVTAFEQSNKGFKFDNDETKFKDKLIGLVLAEEEYTGNDGAIKTRLYVSSIHSIDKIRKGDYKVPEKKLLNGSAKAQANTFETLTGDDSELPF